MRLGVLALTLLCALGATLHADDPPVDRDAAKKQVRELLSKSAELRQKGSYAEARSLAEKAVEVSRISLGPEDSATGACLNSLGLILKKMNERAGARAAYEQALAIRRKALGEENAYTAQTMCNLGVLLQEMGEMEAAGALLERSLAVREKVLGRDDPAVAQSLDGLGEWLRATGSLQAAKSSFERALAIDEKTTGPEGAAAAIDLDNLGNVCEDLGDLAKSEQFHERALAAQRKLLGDEHPDTALSRHNLAHVLDAMGDFGRAEREYEGALAVFEKLLGPTAAATTITRATLGWVLLEEGKPDRARELIERAAADAPAAFGAEGPDTAAILNLRALMEQTVGHFREALPIDERVLEILRKSLGPRHPGTVKALLNVGYALQGTGEYSQACERYEEALRLLEDTVGPDHPDTAHTLDLLATLAGAMGDPARADTMLERAWQSHRTSLTQLLPTLSGRERSSYMPAHAADLKYYLRGFVTQPAKTYAAAMVWKGAALRASATAERLPEDAPKELRDAAVRLADTRRALAGLFLGKQTPKPGEPAIRVRADDLEREIGALEALLAEKAPAFAARAFLEASVEGVRQALPEGATLLDLLENCGELHAWVLGREGEVRYFSLGKAADLDLLARRFREALEKDDANGWEEAGSALVQKLGPSLTAALEGTKTLYLSPDGALATIPWGLLPDGDAKNHHFLVERLPIVQVHGGAGLVMAARTAGGAPASAGRRGEGLIAYGDVDYTGVQPPPSPLPATKKEVEGIAALYKGGTSRVRTGKDASKAAFLREAPSARYVHVATHGFFDLENLRVAVGTRGFAGPVQSAPLMESADERHVGGGWNPLLLSGILLAAGEGQDGVLTAEELQSLDLRGVDLVVLSACETGRGELAAGEGVLGLSRALAVAGAHGFMLSLWQVPDAATHNLMDGFYDGLWTQGLSAEDALRATQLRLLAADRDAKRFRPSTWGAWVLIR